MADRLALPTKSQILAIDDAAALRDILDQIDGVITSIETRLEYSGFNDEDWRGRAQGALVKHRIIAKQVARRLSAVKAKNRKAGKSAEPSIRPADENDPLTNEVLTNRPAINADRIQTVEAIDAALTWIGERIVATENDRNDEIGLAAIERDARFMALANPTNILTILDELASSLGYGELANRDLAKVYDENQILLAARSADQDRIRELEGALALVRMSRGWQYLADESRQVIDAALHPHTKTED